MKIKFLALGWFCLLYFSYLYIEWSSVPQIAGYVYVLDDVYIHLQIAKNLAQHGILSINSNTFDAASSSPIYSAVLAILIKIFGNSAYLPLIINFFLGAITSWMAVGFILRHYGKRAALLSGIALQAIPMVYMMSLISMEHTLHIFLMVLFMIVWFENEQRDFNGKYFIFLEIIITVNSLVRFESMFLTAAIAAILLLRKKVIAGFIIFLCGMLPIVTYGFFSLSNGGMFFPNSVMLKGSMETGQGLLEIFKAIFVKIFNKSFLKDLLVPTGIFLIYALSRKKKISVLLREESFPLIVLITAYLHLIFGVLSQRYENYILLLIFLAMIPVLLFLKKQSRLLEKIAFIIGILYFIVFGAYRLWYHDKPLRKDSQNIYHNQVRLSKFLRQNYFGKTVIANDIGAITYFGGIRLLDMYGLGSTEVAKFRSFQKGNSLANRVRFSEFIDTIAIKNHAEIAAIYPEWFEGEIPKNWILVGRWPIYDAEERGKHRFINFYAVTKKQAPQLQKNLENFRE